MKENNDNTKPEFFALWSIRQLQVECARLNKVMKECSEITGKAKTISEYEQTGGLDETNKR